MFYKKRICVPDTAADIAARHVHRSAHEQAKAERRVKYPVITPDNFEEVSCWMEARIAQIKKEAKS